MKLTWNTDRIVSLMAMVVGLGSLVIILYQTTLMRDSQHASVMPYLAIVVQSNDQATNLVVRNVGIGPAVLNDVRVRYKGKATRSIPTTSSSSSVPTSSRATA